MKVTAGFDVSPEAIASRAPRMTPEYVVPYGLFPVAITFKLPDKRLRKKATGEAKAIFESLPDNVKATKFIYQCECGATFCVRNYCMADEIIYSFTVCQSCGGAKYCTNSVVNGLLGFRLEIDRSQDEDLFGDL